MSRPYDATRRRERAEAERRATRRRVLAAATRLFVERGYTKTTMTDIAKEADVALQSVYKAGKSKAELLHHVVDLAVAGDDEDVMIHERAPMADVAKEPDPVKQVELFADAIAATQERSAPVQAAYRQAAAVEDAVAASYTAAQDRRRQTYAIGVGMLPSDRLRRSREECIDSAWAMGSPEVFHLLRVRRQWTPDQYRSWLRHTLTETLLEPARPRQPGT